MDRDIYRQRHRGVAVTVTAVVLTGLLVACSGSTGSDGESAAPESAEPEASASVEASEAEDADEAEPDPAATDPNLEGIEEYRIPKWGETTSTPDGEHEFTVTKTEATVIDDEDGTTKADGVQFDVTYTNNSNATVDAEWDITTMVFSGTGEGDPAYCEDEADDPQEAPSVPPGQTAEWQSCYIVDDPENVAFDIMPPMSDEEFDGTGNITYGLTGSM